MVPSIIDHHLVIDPEARTVVRGCGEGIETGCLDLDVSDPLGRKIAVAWHALADRQPADTYVVV